MDFITRKAKKNICSLSLRICYINFDTGGIRKSAKTVDFLEMVTAVTVWSGFFQVHLFCLVLSCSLQRLRLKIERSLPLNIHFKKVDIFRIQIGVNMQAVHFVVLSALLCLYPNPQRFCTNLDFICCV